MKMIRQNTCRIASGIATRGFFVSVAALSYKSVPWSLGGIPTIPRTKDANSHGDGFNARVEGSAKHEDRGNAPEPGHERAGVVPVPEANGIRALYATSSVAITDKSALAYPRQTRIAGEGQKGTCMIAKT